MSSSKKQKSEPKKPSWPSPGNPSSPATAPCPPVPEFKVTQIVKYEIQQQIPFSLDQIALDYQVLDRTEAGGYDVMMAAIKVDVVEKQLEVLRKTRRSIDIVDVAPIAAYNWLRHTGEFGEDGQCVALLDLGATTTDIVIQKDNQFKFTRSLHVGGNDITSAIASNFNMNFQDADKLKREKGFAPTGDTERDGRGGAVIGQVLGRLVGEVNRSFAYFRSQPGGGPVVRVVVTGGGACLRNIIPFLQSQLGIEVRIAQPLAGLAVSPKANEASEHPEQACVALGLALRCCQSVPIQINLIPPRVLEIARRKEQVFYWILSLATMYLILASIIPVTAARDEQVQQRIKQLEQVLASYDPVLIQDPQRISSFETDFDEVQSDIAGYKNDVNRLDEMRKHRNFWLPYLEAINLARPIKGTIAINSLETIVLGGKNNTGVSARKLAKGGAASDQEDAPTKEKAAPKPEKSSAKSGLGALANLGSFQSSATSSSGPGVMTFPGLGPLADVVEPNALSLVGYADNLETLRAFVEGLNEQEAFINKGVYWYVKNSDFTGESDLYDANLSPSREAGASEEKSAEGGGLGALGGLGDFSAPTRSNRGRGAEAFDEVEVLTFHIDVQFLGKAQKQPK